MIAKLKRGEGPVWGTAKAVALGVLRFHIPVAGPTRVLFGGLYHAHVAVREGWIWARRFFWNEPLFRSRCESVGARFQMEQLPYLTGRGRIVIGAGVRLSGKQQIGFGRGIEGGLPELVIGEGTFVGHNCSFNAVESIRIGRHCMLATDAGIRDHDGHPLDAERRRAGEPAPAEGVGAVVIEDDVWIGAGALILKGVTVGARSVVAAAAVVTKDVPADVVVAGNPARVVKELAGDEDRGGGWRAGERRGGRGELVGMGAYAGTREA